jgi:hypothetical protein
VLFHIQRIQRAHPARARTTHSQLPLALQGLKINPLAFWRFLLPFNGANREISESDFFFSLCSSALFNKPFRGCTLAPSSMRAKIKNSYLACTLGRERERKLASYGRILRGMLYMLDFTSSTFSVQACVCMRKRASQPAGLPWSDDSWLTVPFCRCLSLRVPRGPSPDANSTQPTRQLMKKHQRCWLLAFSTSLSLSLSLVVCICIHTLWRSTGCA